jgi:uncharacterized membrane protein YagU involved in acid resistance
MDAYYALASIISKACTGQPALNQDRDASIKTAQAIGLDRAWAASVIHYSLGAAMGVAYSVASEQVPMLTAGTGLAFGAAAWFGADEIAVPAMGFAYGPAQTKLSARANALGSHLVFGVVTHLTRNLLLND